MNRAPWTIRAYPQHTYVSSTNPFSGEYGDTMGGARKVYLCPAYKRGIVLTNAPYFGQLAALSYAYNAWGCSLEEYGKNAKWVAHKPEVMMRWNQDHEPHSNIWTMNLLELDP